MDQYKISTTLILSKDEQRRRLAQAYALILTWPDPPEKKPAGCWDFGENTEPSGMKGGTIPDEDCDVLDFTPERSRGKTAGDSDRSAPAV